MIFDLTQEFKKELNGYPQESNHQYLPSKIPPFLKLYVTYSEDIYQKLLRIKMILTDNRENYFSNASFTYEAFTERQREQLIENIRLSLQTVLSQINELKEGLKNQFDSQRKTQEEHMKSVVLCLYQLLKEIEKTYFQFEQFSLKRKKKIEATISIDKSDEKGKYQVHIPQPKSREAPDAELEKESGLLIIEKISRQKQLEKYKNQMEKFHELISTMENVVLEQELKTSAFLEIGQTGLFHIERGNKNLVEANMLAKATGKWWSLLFISMALSLLILDFLKS